MTTLTLTSIKRFDKDKDGKLLMTRDGRPYVRLVIGTKEYEKTLSGFDGPATKDWKEGETVEVEVEQKGDYLNFKVPKSGQNNGEVMKLLQEITSRVFKTQMLIEELVADKRKNEAPTGIDYPESDEEPAF